MEFQWALPLSSFRTSLHAAAFSGHVDCVQLLLSHDAPVDAVDQLGRTALMMAAEKGRVGALGMRWVSRCVGRVNKSAFFFS